MDYHKLYYSFIKYCRSSTPRERLIFRNPNDFRLTNNLNIYIEIHHIIPKKLGGLDEASNLVALLPEEHLFAHKLRYKAYNNRVDMLAVRYGINGFNKFHLRNLKLTKKVLRTVSWMRQNAAEFRKLHGWISIEGRQSISEARRGKVVVKDINTGIIIGSIDRAHPKIIAGEWVHHTKGRKASKKERDQHSSNRRGSGNNKYSGWTDEQILEKAVHYFLEKDKNKEPFTIKDWLIFSNNTYKMPISYQTKSRFTEFIGTGHYRFVQALKKFDSRITDELINSGIKRKTKETSTKISESLKRRAHDIKN